MNVIENIFVLDVYHISLNMREDEIEQYLAITGLDNYDPDVCTRTVLGMMGEIRFCLFDDDGQAYCIGGYLEISPKVFQTWMMGTNEGWEKHWRSITKFSRRTMDALLESDRCNRIQCTSLSTREFTHNWYKRGLGMKYESLIQKYYADGRDAVCYVRIKE